MPSPGTGTGQGLLLALAAQSLAPKDGASPKASPCPGLCPRAHEMAQHTSLSLCFKNGSGVLSPSEGWGCLPNWVLPPAAQGVGSTRAAEGEALPVLSPG